MDCYLNSRLNLLTMMFCPIIFIYIIEETSVYFLGENHIKLVYIGLCLIGKLNKWDDC